MYCGFIVTVKNIRPHPNADKLKIVTVFNEDVIVDLSYDVGKRCVYFPSDGQLGEEFCEVNNLVRKKDEQGNSIGGYLDPNKRNVKAIRLRGVVSDGLLLPIESLSTWTNVDELKEGEQITILNKVEICKKYIPRTNHRRNNSDTSKTNKKKVKEFSYPYFEEHVDTEQLRFNTDKFRVGDICTITLKCHGTSARTSNCLQVSNKKSILRKLFHLPQKQMYKIVSGTRRTIIDTFDKDTGFYGTHAFRKPYHDNLKDKLPKGMTVYYEIVGWVDNDQTIMSKANNSKISNPEFKKMYGDETIFSYGCEQGQNDAYVYRITMTNEDGIVVELSWADVQVWCEKLGMKPVPTFETFIFTTVEDLWERVYKYYDGPDPIGKTHVREGVVVRIENRPKFTAYKDKNQSFKILEGIMKEDATAPDMEEAEEILQDELS